MRHLRLYRAIAMIVKTGSIRAAAERLAISPSALNRAIQGFEAELGVEIFERIPGGVRLSVVGELLHGPITDHLTRFEDFRLTVAELQGGTAGTLSLAVSADLANDILPPLIAAFRNSYPRVSLDIQHFTGAQVLADRQADLALVSTAEVGDGVTVACARDYPILGTVHPAHPYAGRLFDLSDLEAHTVVAPSPGGGVRLALDVALRRYGLRPQGIVSTMGPAALPRLGPLPDLHLGLGEGPGVRTDITGLRLAPVQVAALHLAAQRPSIHAQRFLTILQRSFD